MDNLYLYAETAFHHEGDMEFMISLIDEVVKSGINGIKFQVLTNPSDFVSTKHSSFEELSKYCFSIKDWRSIFSNATKNGLDIIFMPLNIDSFKLLNDFEIKYIDIHSVSFNDQELVQKVKESGLDVILGVGGRTQKEIAEKMSFFEGQIKVLMTGFQSFPSKLEKIKLSRIKFLKSLYPDISIGYADHSSSDHVHSVVSNEYAYILGARIFEKHITLKEGSNRVDSASAISGEKLIQIKNNLNFLDKSINLDEKESFVLGEEETTYRNRQLICVAAYDIPKGEIINYTQIRMKMIDTVQNPISEPNIILGQVAIDSFKKDEAITLNKLSMNKY